ncbi:Crp/Fnr family transcriptional regulator [Flavobacterium amniphilum]|uniref:Crp/Fnr family transcriptional regulator n=1 Tax=Flavobacterium amniphilum TaxID=1834035 RepID=UPI00202A8630|nr:Crp/Fnr family transcriptional regulator [Flavobacterium amniphilum]MCL9806200.1 Crp/Fnr family transcriptional regulator [Flavobacterium amniphilum]
MLTNLFKAFPKLKNIVEKYQNFWYEEYLPAKHTLLNEGDVSNTLYFIVKGCIRLSNNYNGKEITIQFFFENEFVSSFESYFKNTPSAFSIETIEECRLLVIKKENWRTILDENPAFKELFVEFTSDRFINYIHHFLSYIQEKPEERYLNLIKNKSHILQRVPLQYIASYLGITTVSLSRIRARKTMK